MKRFIFAFTLLGIFAANGAWAQTIRIIVPFSAGGSSDLLARSVAKQLNSTNQAAVVENVPGNSGQLGLQRLQEAGSNDAIVFFPTHLLVGDAAFTKLKPLAGIATEHFGLWSSTGNLQKNVSIGAIATQPLGQYAAKLANSLGGDFIPYASSLAAVASAAEANSNVLIGSSFFSSARERGLKLIAVSHDVDAANLKQAAFSKLFGANHSFGSAYAFFASASMPASRQQEMMKMLLSAAATPAVEAAITNAKLEIIIGNSSELGIFLEQSRQALFLAPLSQAATLRDDPKVFGRSARGG